MTNLRIRLSRQHKTLKLSRYIGMEGSQFKAGEWITKTFDIPGGLLQLFELDPSPFDGIERSAMDDLCHFVEMCDALELFHNQQVLNSSKTVSFKEESGLTESTCTTKISTMKTALRPRRLSTTPARTRTSAGVQDSKEAYDINIVRERQTRPPSLATQMPTESVPFWSRDEFTDDQEAPLGALQAGIQTRFIPSVGWCMRYGNVVSQGGRYRIMFLDGVTLDIDVDEEFAEFKSLSGDVTRSVSICALCIGHCVALSDIFGRHKIGEIASKRKVSERMKVFEEFVSMFEDQPND